MTINPFLFALVSIFTIIFVRILFYFFPVSGYNGNDEAESGDIDDK